MPDEASEARGGRTPRDIVRENFPWDVPVEMRDQGVYLSMLDHGEYMATGGVGMDQTVLAGLRMFYDGLRKTNAVLEFTPSGFLLRTRVNEDEDLLIRVNEHTKLTDEGEMIWCFPPREPDVDGTIEQS